MNLQLKTWQKILLTLFCFGIAIVGFIIKLPSTFRGYDKELHAAFYFCAAAFLNILFAKRNILIHALIFGALYLFGMAIEHAQVFSKKMWQIPHGRYDPEDVQGNLRGLLLFSAVWLLYIAIYYLARQKEAPVPVTTPGTANAEELIYEDKGDYFLAGFSPGNNELLIRSSNNTNAGKVFSIDLCFKAVHHIQLPAKMQGIRVCKVSRKNIPSLKPNPSGREAIYRIEDNSGNSAYIDAGSFTVFHNEPGNSKEIFSTTT